MLPRILVLAFALVIRHWSFGQNDCAESVWMQFSSLEEFVDLDSSLVTDLLKPVRPVRRKDLPDFEYGTPENPSHQILQFMDGFEDTVAVYIGDSLLFKGIADSNPVLGAAGVEVDLGVRNSASPKRLRVEYRDHCLTSFLDGGYPIVMIWTSGSSWVQRFQDYWSALE